MGHSKTCIALILFKKEELKILNVVWDRNLGGRDFDMLLMKYFGERFKKKYGSDPLKNGKTMLRLAEACKKVKLNLSMGKSSSVSIDCLMDGEDLDDSISRDEFEALANPLVERLGAMVRKIAGDNSKGTLHSFELVGGNTRVPCVVKTAEENFGMAHSRTLNSDECISEGAAVACAMESPL